MDNLTKDLTAMPEWRRFVRAAQSAATHAERLDIIAAPGLTLDSSGQPYSAELLAAGVELVRARGLAEQTRRLFAGEVVNTTEERAAWHTALRAAHGPEQVRAEHARLDAWVQRADIQRRWRHIVHIGIGGSDWGVRLAVAAFGYAGTWRDVRFVSNIDGHAIEGGLAGLDPRNTLVVLASKSFTTAETLENGARAREWLQAAGLDPSEHLVAITAAPERARAWGVPPEQIFGLWDWVGGRFSVWSTVSLTTSLAVGSAVLEGMRAGAAAMDEHFASAAMEQNAPVRMALAGVVNGSIAGHGTLNIAPYDFRLANIVSYIQQLDMESLGKSVDVNGRALQFSTGPVVWGMPGTDAQHTFFQWLHQGTGTAPVDFIMCAQADHGWPSHHRQLLANCLAQRQALICGKTHAQALAEGLADGLSPERAGALAAHREQPGGRPNHLIVLPRLSPYALGALLALYEHKVFCQAVIWGINPFDQWGVDYGKRLARGILAELEAQHEPEAAAASGHDASTHHWVRALRNYS